MTLPEKDLVEYLNKSENGVISSMQEMGYALQVLYKPGELVAVNEIKSYPTQEQRDSIAQHYNKYLYFQLSISRGKEDLNSMDDSGGTIYSYLNNELGSHVQLHADDKEVKLVDFIYVNMYGSTGQSDVLLVFENNIEGSEDLRLLFDSGPIGLGIQTFEFKTADIKNVPKLKI